MTGWNYSERRKWRISGDEIYRITAPARERTVFTVVPPVYPENLSPQDLSGKDTLGRNCLLRQLFSRNNKQKR